MAARGGLVLTAATGPNRPSTAPSNEDLDEMAHAALRQTFGEDRCCRSRPPASRRSLQSLLCNQYVPPNAFFPFTRF